MNGDDSAGQGLHVRLLGPFSVSSGGLVAGPWPRPSAKRLCELVFVSPGRRVSRDLVCDELFGDLDPRAAARSVSKALSMARGALAALGPHAPGLLQADLSHIWGSADAEVDAEAHEQALRAALSAVPGQQRDDQLVAALAEQGELLADEPYADWAMRPRERLTALRQEARLALARDRAKGAGQSRPEAVLAAWEDCFEHDPASEEAAAALVRIYFAQRRRELAVRTYERCSAALAELGLRVSPPLEETYATAAFETGAPRADAGASSREELRTVSILSAEVAVPPGLASELGLESLREIVAGSVAAVIAEVEALGGTVTSVSGSGLQAVFGAPEAHEDDPERATRAAFRALLADAAMDGPPMLRIGVETGPAVLGPIGGGAKVEYGAVGEVVGASAALQSRARPGSALVGPVTRAAVGHLFSWGPSEDVTVSPDARPLVAAYLRAPRPRAASRPSGLGGSGPLVGRQAELAVLGAAVREAVRGNGSVLIVKGEPGLGKTRLLQEGHKLITDGRPPLWLEGRGLSYASSTPYGLYQHLLANWAGVTPDLPDAVVRPALEKALGRLKGAEGLLPVLARMMGLSSGAALGRMNPGELQRATFEAWRSLISRLAAVVPTVLELEDLHWADPTSLRLTLDLADLTAGRRLLILATTRPGAGPEVAKLEDSAAAGLPVREIVLGRLPGDAERALARSLIGEAVGQEVLDAVLSSVDGNPLFLEERLSSLLETQGLVREQGTWRVSEAARQEVPQALERLVLSRVDRLSPAARDAIRHASVLGFEFPVSLLAAVYETDQPLEPILAELRAKDLLHDVPGLPEPAFCFRHALIQEATYRGLLRAERRTLHGRAAWALEAASSDRLEEVAAVLGRHFAAAGEKDRALLYLELAGDHATGAFANDEAIASFRAAMAVAGEQPAGVGLRAKLANVLWRTGRRGQARQAFREALDLAGSETELTRAHLLTRLGRLEMADLHYEAAAEAFDAAQELLGNDPADMDAATVEEWLELMVDGLAGLYAMRDDPGLVLATLDTARPVLAEGSPPRRYSYYMHLAYARVALNRGRVSEADIADMREGLAAAGQSDEKKDAAYATYFLGRLLWLRGDLAQAQEYLEQALAMAERMGETILLGESLLGVTLNALRRHDTEAVRALAPRALTAASGMASTEYLAGAKASLAWLAWQDQRPEDVLKLAEEIAGIKVTAFGDGSHNRWVYLWPLLAVQLDAGRLADAVIAGRQLLHGTQQDLPEDLESALQAATAAWERDDHEETRAELTAALALARDLRYA